MYAQIAATMMEKTSCLLKHNTSYIFIIEKCKIPRLTMEPWDLLYNQTYSQMKGLCSLLSMSEDNLD